MELHHSVRDEHFKDLEKESMKNVLIKRADRLERFLKRIYPQFLGLLEYCRWLCDQKRQQTCSGVQFIMFLELQDQSISVSE